MRDYILLYINGREHRISNAQAFVPITDFLRSEQSLCGTKVVCAEGDCGACTVLLGRLSDGKLKYKPVNACIQYVFQLDCSHIITVEGLNGSRSSTGVRGSGDLNPVQSAMVECHGAQCGYCTPGFIMAMCASLEERPSACARELKEDLTGNLCRCTGYEAIMKAGLAIDRDAYTSVHELYPGDNMVKQFEHHRQEPVWIRAEEHELLVPVEVKKAVQFKKEHPQAVVVSGGTDVAVTMNKRGVVPEHLISTANLPDLASIDVKTEGDRQVLAVGARVTLRELERFVEELDPDLYYILWVFGSPQIRNAGTLAGNIANGSPIADTLPFLFVMEAEVEVESVSGSRRIKMTDLYEGYRKLSLASDEIITRVHLPLPASSEILRLYKISRRQHLDISAFTAAILIVPDSESEYISSARVAYGGVGPVVIRLPKVERFLEGKELSAETFIAAGKVARAEIEPISDVRGSRDFRLQLAENIMCKFYHEAIDVRELACQS